MADYGIFRGGAWGTHSRYLLEPFLPKLVQHRDPYVVQFWKFRLKQSKIPKFTSPSSGRETNFGISRYLDHFSRRNGSQIAIIDQLTFLRQVDRPFYNYKYSTIRFYLFAQLALQGQNRAISYVFENSSSTDCGKRSKCV